MSSAAPHKSSVIFLDHHATTPVDSRVLEAMLPYFTEQYANPHSVEHNLGLRAARVVEDAQRRVAELIGARPEHVVFTSGATESNNLALRGITAGRKKTHFVTSTIEHSSVAATLAELERDGHQVTWLTVDAEGRVNPDDVARALTETTALVSIQAANGEIGTIQAIGAIGHLCRERGVLFHTDAVQAYGHVSLDVERDRIDLMSLSAHKIYGPKGIGALVVAAGARRRLRPQITGGNQQDGLRAGTVPTPLAVGFGRAAELALIEGHVHDARIAHLRNTLLARLNELVPGMRLNGPRSDRLPGNLSVCIDGIDADSLLLALSDVALSTGSACNAGAIGVSPVLLAIGLSPAIAETAIRIGIGRTTTITEVERAADLIARGVEIICA